MSIDAKDLRLAATVGGDPHAARTTDRLGGGFTGVAGRCGVLEPIVDISRWRYRPFEWEGRSRKSRWRGPLQAPPAMAAAQLIDGDGEEKDDAASGVLIEGRHV